MNTAFDFSISNNFNVAQIQTDLETALSAQDLIDSRKLGHLALKNAELIAQTMRSKVAVTNTKKILDSEMLIDSIDNEVIANFLRQLQEKMYLHNENILEFVSLCNFKFAILNAKR
jgi:hypothetical protein